MSGIGVLHIVKGSRRQSRCGRGCGQRITWATKVRDGRHKAGNIPLVEHPIVIREEPQTWGAIEVIAFDQIHRCPKTAKTDAPRQRRSHPAASRPMKASERADQVYAAFTKDRLAELRKRLAQPSAPKAPDTGRLW